MAGMGNLISGDGGQAVRMPSEPLEASVLFPSPEWVIAPGYRNHLLSLAVKTSVPFPLCPSFLQAPATASPAIALDVCLCC